MIAHSNDNRDLTGNYRKRGEKVPKIVVKKEPSSPGPPSTTRRRPARLHLEESNTDSAATRGPRTAAPNLATMRDAGMACLSPGFATQDPTMREQLQRSASVREQQRSIIEARLQRQPKTAGGQKEGEPSGRAGSAKRRPPNSLSIVPPPHRAFANERVIQSAPLNQSFTGRNQFPPHQQPHAGSHLQHSTTHSQHMNRLPPISDVLNASSSEHHPPRPLDSSRPTYSSGYNVTPAQPSPSNVAYQRPREHRSAEEALQHMSGGREDRLPRIVHYGGHQPPTPPSPLMHQGQTTHKLPPQRGYEPPLSAGLRRTFAEFERDNDGLGSRDSPETKRQKKEEFLALCARAWELFHS